MTIRIHKKTFSNSMIFLYFCGPKHKARKVGRAVEGSGFENRHSVTAIRGSNPLLSANRCNLLITSILRRFSKITGTVLGPCLTVLSNAKNIERIKKNVYIQRLRAGSLNCPDVVSGCRFLKSPGTTSPTRRGRGIVCAKKMCCQSFNLS